MSALLQLFLFALLTPGLLAIHGKCRALVLQGGGFRGAYEIGAVRGLVKSLAMEEVSYDVIGGVSIGSLNAGMLALFEIGDEENMVNFASNMWLNFKKEYLFQSWPLGIVQGFFTKQSIFDNSNTRKFYESLHENRTLKRNITFASVDSKTGEYLRWSERVWQDKGKEDYLTLLMSSAAYPMMFPPIIYGKRVLVDGGVLIDLDMGGVIERCREIVERDEDIIVDIILGTAKELKEGSHIKQTTIPALIRVLELRSYWGAMYEMAKQIVEYPQVKVRYIVKPSQPLPHPLNPTNFNSKFIEQWMQLGEEDAINVVRKGEGMSVRESIHELKLRRSQPVV